MLLKYLRGRTEAAEPPPCNQFSLYLYQMAFGKKWAFHTGSGWKTEETVCVCVCVHAVRESNAMISSIGGYLKFA